MEKWGEMMEEKKNEGNEREIANRIAEEGEGFIGGTLLLSLIPKFWGFRAFR